MTWKQTDLNVDPPKWELADTDKETFGFDAEEAIASATATLIRLDTLEADGTVTTPSLAGTVASVTVSGLTRGVDYELSMTFITAADRRWTRTLAIPCVA